MADLPPATVEHPRRGRLRPEQAATLRKLLGVALVIGATFVCCRMLKHYTRSTSSQELERRQAKARARVGTGLDAVFAKTLEDESPIIDLAATFEIAAGLGAGYEASDCALGMNAGFEEALGPDVLAVSALGMGPASRVRLTMTATITPSGATFQLPHASEAYPGIAIAADLKLLGTKLRVASSPQGQIEFKRFRIASMPLERMTASDVAGGIMQGACRDVAFALVEHLTTWERPAPPVTDPLAECAQGFGCRENAERLEATEPAVAATLYDTACQHDDEAACVRLAELAIARRDKAKNLAMAEVTIEMACGREVARACHALGALRLVPSAPGQAVTERKRRDALTTELRACDLGIAEACAAAVPLLAATPFAEAAPVLATHAPIISKKLGPIFALRWGQWTKWDRGGPTAWTTKAPARLPDGMIITPFEVAALPAGITAPPGVETVYAIALGGDSDRCLRCNPSGGGDSIYNLRSVDCVCAVTRK